MNKQRIHSVFVAMRRERMEQLIISDPSAVRYLTGKLIHPGERMMVLLLDGRERKLMLVLSKLFPQSEEIGCPVVYYDDTEDPVALLAGYMPGEGIVGVDKEWPAGFLIRLINRMPGRRMIDGSGIIDAIRQIKSGKEQKLMIEASRINDLAMERLIPQVGKGLTEKGLADALLDIYLELGAEGFSFEPICCYGANAADPHHENDRTTGRPGDAVILDIGCRKNGYCSDMTRTVFLGSVSEEQRKVYEIVKEANLRAIAVARPGIRFCDVDAAARGFILQHGYGDYFVHRTGHSIGQDVHEYGDVSSANKNILKPGMVFSIEPGIYLPGRFGVRIEDLVLITLDGCLVLNNVSKELTVI